MPPHTKKIRYEVQKIPLDYEPIDHQPNFEKLPILYLEMLQNKKKIKKEFIGVDFRPSYMAGRGESGDSGDKKSDFVKPVVVRKLDDLLYDSEPDTEIVSKYSVMKEKISTSVKPLLKPSPFQKQETVNIPAPLSQINKSTDKSVIDITQPQTSKERDDEDKKRELIDKLERLQKNNPNKKLSKFSMMSDLDEIQRYILNLEKSLSIEQSADTYKIFLGSSIYGLHWAMSSFTEGLVGDDFIKFHMKSMKTYDKMLMEMSETSYVATQKQWPAWVRLGGLMVINTSLYLMGKTMLKRTGSNYLEELYDGDNGGDKSHANKMRGPKIVDMSEEEKKEEKKE
jgi:hypothetical protein